MDSKLDHVTHASPSSWNKTKWREFSWVLSIYRGKWKTEGSYLASLILQDTSQKSQSNLISVSTLGEAALKETLEKKKNGITKLPGIRQKQRKRAQVIVTYAWIWWYNCIFVSYNAWGQVPTNLEGHLQNWTGHLQKHSGKFDQVWVLRLLVYTSSLRTHPNEHSSMNIPTCYHC